MRKSWKTAVLVALLLSGAKGVTRLYKPGERGVRATAVIASSVDSSVIKCGAACTAEPDCLGFNWRTTSRSCEIVSSLRVVENVSYFDIYVPEVQRTAIELSYACPTCINPNPIGNSDWELDCLPNDRSVAVGVASRSTLSDMDYLLCRAPPGLLLKTNDGAIISGSRICTDVIGGRPFPVTALWADQQFFNSPTTVSYQCREIISGEKIDTSRCVVPEPSTGPVPGVDGVDHQLLLCPPHMVAATIYWESSLPNVICCLIY